MNAETRAKEIVDAVYQFCEEHELFVRDDALDRLQAAITKAITRAQNDKLEEAAQCADVAQAEADACSSRVVEEEIVAAAVSGCCGVIAATIRSLKKD